MFREKQYVSIAVCKTIDSVPKKSVRQKVGFHDDIFEWMYNDATRLRFLIKALYVGLCVMKCLYKKIYR